MVISNDGERVIAKNCTCARGKSFCHHMVAVGLYAMHNISRTDVPCKWTQQKPGDEVCTYNILLISINIHWRNIKIVVFFTPSGAECRRIIPLTAVQAKFNLERGG